MKLFGKILMSLAIAVYAFIPPLVDLLTDTHVFHDGWMPHARMHTVWLLGVTTGVGLISLALLWWPASHRRLRANIAGMLSLMVYAAFFLSAATLSLYGGALSDITGGVDKGPFGIDANLFTFTLATSALVFGWVVNARYDNSPST